MKTLNTKLLESGYIPLPDDCATVISVRGPEGSETAVIPGRVHANMAGDYMIAYQTLDEDNGAM